MILLAFVSFLIFFFISYRNPIIALAGLSALLPTYLLRFSICGIPCTVLEMIIAGIILGWLFFKANDNFKFLKERLSFIKWPLGLFFIVSIIAVFVSPDIIRALGIWKAYFLESIFVFIIILDVIQDRKDFSKIIFGLSISAFYLSIFAIGQRFFGLPITPPWQSELRATSLFPYPNALGLFLAPIVILMTGRIIEITKHKKMMGIIFYSITIALSILGIISAQSDGAIFALLGAGFIFIGLNVFTNKKFRSGGLIILLMVVIAGGLLFSMISPIKEKVFLQDWSGFVRLTMWGETFNMLKDNWFFGAGLAGFQDKILPYHESRDWMEVFLYPHNIVLNFWTELGLLGLGAFIWLLERFFKLCYTAFNKEKVFITTALCAMAVIIIHGLVDVPYFKNDLSILFWIIFSMPFIKK